MRRRTHGILGTALLLFWGAFPFAAAAAEEVAPASQPLRPAPAKPGGNRLDHRTQGGLGIIVGSGYRGLVRYQGSASCEGGGSDRTFCHSRVPTFLDIEGSFGVTRALSTIVDVSVGLEKDFTHGRPFAVAPGIKYYVDPEGRMKFFVTLQLALDFTEQLPDVPTVDVGVRNAVGLQFDMHRLFGFWLQLGDTLAFRRYFRFELDAAGGIEARFPP